MHTFAWYVLLLRVIGVVFVGIGLPHAIESGANFINGWVNGQSPILLMTWGDVGGMVVTVVYAFWMLGLGLYLLFGGKWLVRKSLKGLAGQCVMCGYAIEGNLADRCPECGAARLDLRPRGHSDVAKL